MKTTYRTNICKLVLEAILLAEGTEEQTSEKQSNEGDADAFKSARIEMEYFDGLKGRLKDLKHGTLPVWKVKRVRAQGGCLGTRSRRRTWQAAKSPGEEQTSIDPGMSEWGNPARKTLATAW